jgi:hypothetical protein
MEKETRPSSEVDVGYELTALECEVEVCKMVLRKSVRRAETVFGVGNDIAIDLTGAMVKMDKVTVTLERLNAS